MDRAAQSSTGSVSAQDQVRSHQEHLTKSKVLGIQPLIFSLGSHKRAALEEYQHKTSTGALTDNSHLVDKTNHETSNVNGKFSVFSELCVYFVQCNADLAVVPLFFRCMPIYADNGAPIRHDRAVDGLYDTFVHLSQVK